MLINIIIGNVKMHKYFVVLIYSL